MPSDPLAGDSITLGARFNVAQTVPLHLASPAEDYWSDPRSPRVRGWQLALERGLVVRLLVILMGRDMLNLGLA